MAINFLNTVAVDENVLFVDTVNDQIGIGTASPDAKLDVRSTSRTAPVVLKLGNGIISGDNGVIVSQIRSYINNSNVAADELARIQVENGSGSHDDGNLSFWTRDGLNNVDADKQLQINGKGVVELKKSGTSALPVLVLGEDVDTGFFRPSSNNIALSTAGEERMRVTSGGILMVGGTAGGYAGTKIHVGNFTDTQNGINILSSTTGYGYVLFGDGTGADTYRGQITYYHGDDSMVFNTSGSEKLRIVSGGGISFAGATNFGSAGQVLKSNGSASPAWVDASTVIGGPYLPLTGGTLTGPLIVDTAGGVEKMTFNNEYDTAPIADSFIGNTSKSYISFGVVAGSNDPGFIMHESSSVAAYQNMGVLHLCPSDDNSTNDYISIHGSNDPDVLKLHTSGLIETVNLQLQIKSGSGNVYLNDSVDIANNLLVSGAATITSDLTVNGGDIQIDSAFLSNQENTDIDSAAAGVVAQVAHATYTAAFFDFVVKKGTNVRSGTVYACHNGDTTPLVEFTETSTNDLGDTSDVTLSVDISGANMRLVATVTSDDWSVKSLIRAI
jgi:hypothetical protein